MKPVYALVSKDSMNIVALPAVGTLAICEARKHAEAIKKANPELELTIVRVKILRA